MSQIKDRSKVYEGVCNILEGLGLYGEEGDDIRETPLRVCKALEEMLDGYEQSAADILSAQFEAKGPGGQVVTCRDIEFESMCEHHLLPFSGKAHIAYMPRQVVVGLSKMPRLVEMHAHRLQLQERMTRNIANDLLLHLGAKAVVVVTEAHHTCMGHRGVKQRNSLMTCVSHAGAHKHFDRLRRELP